MSSETLLFDATWTEDGEVRTERLVARVAPEPHDVPVFPEYDMAGQFRTIRTVAALTDVPVPPPWWCEPDPSVVGSPFFVMGRVDGEVPPDIPPYNIGPNWLFDASPADQARLQESSIGDPGSPPRHRGARPALSSPGEPLPRGHSTAAARGRPAPLVRVGRQGQWTV